MESNEKISIVVPIYNVERYLRQCLDSIVNQTYKNIEIVCIDDGSSDRSSEILDEYAEKDSRIIAIHQKNIGLSAARNRGAAIASGSYLMFVDSDDWIDLETCDTALKLALRYNADVVFWPYIREFENSSSPKTMFDEDCIVFGKEEFREKVYKNIIGLHGEFLAHPENADTLVTIWGKLYSKSLLDNSKADFIDISKVGTGEDTLYNANVLQDVSCGVYIKKYFSHYRKYNEGSVTKKYKPNLKKQWKNLFEYMSLAARKTDSEQELNNRISLSVIGLGLNAINLPDKEAILQIKGILSDKDYRAAVKTLPMRYFPIHWWVFFMCCKINFAVGVFVLLKCMERLRK